MSIAETTIAVPSTDRYVEAFQSIGMLPDSYLELLRAHYRAPQRNVLADQLARAVGFQTYGGANLHYGRLGRRVGEWLGWRPEPEWLGVLVTFQKPDGQWHWIMRPQVAQALEKLGWVDRELSSHPEEVIASLDLVEGAVYRVSVNAYERNPEARRRCIAHHGASCCICGFDFGDVYGEVANGFIHVHHLRSLSELAAEYLVDPVADLRPVCPNCHAVIHRRTPSYSIEEVRSFLRP